jgi:hypothetical protein
MEPKETPGSPRGGALACKKAVSTTQVEVEAPARTETVLTLRLEPRRHIRWDERVVDNEHMHKKSSKRESW